MLVVQGLALACVFAIACTPKPSRHDQSRNANTKSPESRTAAKSGKKAPTGKRKPNGSSGTSANPPGRTTDKPVAIYGPPQKTPGLHLRALPRHYRVDLVWAGQLGQQFEVERSAKRGGPFESFPQSRRYLPVCTDYSGKP